MSETIVLDPAAVATSRTAVDITPWLTEEGVDWGDSAIEAYLANGAIGASPVDYRLPNRQVTASMRLMDRGAVTFETIRRQLQAKVALIQREGGWISRVTAAGGTVFADVVNATLKLGGDWAQANTTAGRRFDVSAQLSMELLPDWYGSEITLDDKTETSALALTTVLKLSASDAVITGDYPARVRIVVDEDDGDTQLGLIWGLRSRYYDSASTAALTYEAEALTPLDTAAAGALTGASGGTAVTHTTVRTDWTGVVSTTMLAGTANLTHKGTYQCWARCYTTSTTTPDVRLVWRLGDFVNPIENTRQSIPSVSNFHWLNLGEIRLDPTPSGTHRWLGQIHALGGTANSNVSVDAVHFVPVDDGYGVLRAPQIVPTVTSYSGLDSFTSTTAGTALNGRVAPSGGTFVTSGDATDYLFSDDGSQETAKRSAASGTNGRFAVLGSTNFTGVVVESLVAITDAVSTSGFPQAGVIARWTDSSNHLRAVVYRNPGSGGSGSSTTLEIHELITGTKTVIASQTLTNILTGAFYNQWWRVRLTVTAAGQVTAKVIATGTSNAIGSGSGLTAADTVVLEASTTRSSLATGGTLATGKPGIFDLEVSSSSVARYYDDFRVAAIPALDATMYPNQSAELRTEGIFRENSTGVSYAAAPHVGDLPRLPPSGLESRKVELYIKASRGDFDEIADSGIDDISAQVFYRPSWLLLS